MTQSNTTIYKREELSPALLQKCQVCSNGGKNIFPDCLDFDPTQNCSFFKNNKSFQKEEYNCEAYMPYMPANNKFKCDMYGKKLDDS